MSKTSSDPDGSKGAVEQDKRTQQTNTSLRGQLPHRNQNPVIKAHDTDFPEPGENAEHTGQTSDASLLDRDGACEANRATNPEGETQDQDPGQRQKRNQGGKKDDPLAA